MTNTYGCKRCGRRIAAVPAGEVLRSAARAKIQERMSEALPAGDGWKPTRLNGVPVFDTDNMPPGDATMHIFRKAYVSSVAVSPAASPADRAAVAERARSLSSQLGEDWLKKAAALDRAVERFRKEGPFVYGDDDPDGIALGLNGQKVIYVDFDSIAGSAVSTKPEKI